MNKIESFNVVSVVMMMAATTQNCVCQRNIVDANSMKPYGCDSYIYIIYEDSEFNGKIYL